MTMEPGPQNQPVETPVVASTPAALRVQILATEHWSLLATRSQTWNESFARAQMFLSVVLGSVIALALVPRPPPSAGGSPPSRWSCCRWCCSWA